jgi:hypothetical protein
MKATLPWFASVLLSAIAVSAASADWGDSRPAAAGPACNDCGSAEGCAGCGSGHGLISWRPGQVMSSACAKTHECWNTMTSWCHFPAPTCKGAKCNQPIQPQFMYNPYVRSPRDFFMEDR